MFIPFVNLFLSIWVLCLNEMNFILFYLFKYHVIGGKPIVSHQPGTNQDSVSATKKFVKNSIAIWPTRKSNPGPMLILRVFEERARQTERLVFLFMYFEDELYVHTHLRIHHIFVPSLTSATAGHRPFFVCAKLHIPVPDLTSMYRIKHSSPLMSKNNAWWH